MKYSLRYSKTAAKEISKLDNVVRKKIKEALDTKLIKDPISNSVQLRDFEIKGVRRFRVSSYRVIFVIEETYIEILRVGHRREIYRG